MKRRTGKKIGKILLLVALLAIVGGIVYAVLTWPMYPDRQKPAESYQQMKQTAEDLGVLAPPEDVLPWTQPEYDFWLDNTWRFARPCGYTMAGDISYEGTVYSAYIIAFRETGSVGRLSDAAGELQNRPHLCPVRRWGREDAIYSGGAPLSGGHDGPAGKRPDPGCDRLF